MESKEAQWRNQETSEVLALRYDGGCSSVAWSGMVMTTMRAKRAHLQVRSPNHEHLSTSSALLSHKRYLVDRIWYRTASDDADRCAGGHGTTCDSS